ncbi:hypothetical protein ACQPX6_03075 [Actinomycetospora sp. CA-101289]|uniref:hypothetical protein n=1 Tax=Actinomycetospora sp. CA-101289 TaxID=3239893 RepID=UPI003D96717A
MTLAAEVAGLRAALDRLCACWREVLVTAQEDAPAELSAAQRVADDVSEAAGDLEGAMSALEIGSLADTAEAVQRAARSYHRRLRSFDADAALRRALAPHGPEWRAWHTALRTGVRHCEQPLTDVDTALLRCWREVAGSLTPTIAALRVVHEER